MGFWNLGRKKEKIAKERPEKEKSDPEEEQIDQLVEKAISHVMLAGYKSNNNYLFDEKSFKRGKRLLLERTDYMILFKKGLKQYIRRWKFATGKLSSETDLYEVVYNATCVQQFISDYGFYKNLMLNAEGKYNDGMLENCFPDPIKQKRIEEENKKKELLEKKINELKAIVNKPIKYGDSGKNNEEISFDEEFNNFAEKLREQKMDEVIIFKLITRMGELKKQYETVIHHPDKSLVQRLEAQVLFEYYGQIKKQKEDEEKAKYEAIKKGDLKLGIENLSNSVRNIENNVSTLTWLKIIDGIFGP